MKVQKKIPTKKAVLLQTETATKTKQHNKAYPKAALLSSLIQIGEVLLSLNGTDRPDGWQLLEASLRKFYEVNL